MGMVIDENRGVLRRRTHDTGRDGTRKRANRTPSSKFTGIIRFSMHDLTVQVTDDVA
ncbi:hypothetical protein M408DRAFT_209655 [Serendipita vermifera MAFF 305830]|uniref:Uncharacterized protein n=1 Tax=Serendipita vermifera MAFF 305830 TaxID=933852 RepID=A0A0C2WG19_SERVB|nr:hypothetical protein M408DRAFT_209655 [Serendipita vermifera MAFF 305830]